MDGVLVIDKPAGMTSHDVIDVVRKKLRTRRVGHAGTLDPDATGVLVVGLGRATRFLSYSQSVPKRYRAGARFGVTTTTQDASGEVVERRAAKVDAERVAVALEVFTGEIEQVPPMVSAVKVGGERLYRKARRGEEIERAARSVTIHHLSLGGFSPEGPEATLEVVCSGGTYVRTLVHDLGRHLGCGAHLTWLRRIESGGFGESEAVPLDEVGPAAVRPLAAIVAALPRLEADATAASLVADGRPLEADAGVPEGEPVAVVAGGELLAVYRRRGDRVVADRVVPR